MEAITFLDSVDGCTVERIDPSLYPLLVFLAPAKRRLPTKECSADLV